MVRQYLIAAVPFALGICGLIIAIYVFGLPAWRASRAVLTPIEGRLTSITVEDATPHGSGPQAVIHVTYVYNYGGVEYDGNRLEFGYLARQYDPAVAARLAREIEVQDPLIVYVDKARPGRSVLIPETNDGLLWTMAIVFGLPGLLLLIIGTASLAKCITCACISGKGS